MASWRTDEKPDRDLRLSRVLKALRRHRGLSPQQVADAMGMGKRSYERFEAGEGQLKVERIFRFAAVTDSDPYALLASARTGAPEFAVACAENKLVALLVAHARELHGLAGAEIRRLQPQVIIEALTAAFATLGGEIAAAGAVTKKWLKDPPDEPEDEQG